MGDRVGRGRNGVEVRSYRRGLLGRARTVRVAAALFAAVLLAGAAWWTFGRMDALASCAPQQTAAAEVAQMRAYVPATASDAAAFPRSARLDVPARLQYPELPTGCESVALTDVLLFFGFDLATTDIADTWLPRSDTDFVTAFRGDPRSSDGHSCMAPCIVRTADAFLRANGSHLAARDVTGRSFEDVLVAVAGGSPVIAWCTIDLAEPQACYDEAWLDGVRYRLYANSHCVVVSGYDLDASVVYVSDPLAGQVSCDMETFASRYYALGAQAVVVS